MYCMMIGLNCNCRYLLLTLTSKSGYLNLRLNQPIAIGVGGEGNNCLGKRRDEDMDMGDQWRSQGISF